MKIEIRIDMPRGGASRLALFVGLPLALVGAAAVMARAYDDSWIKPGAQVDAVALKAMFDEIQQRAAGTAACPVGYTQDTTVQNMTVCAKPLANGAADEMVKVGTGLASFWIDRYEASVWQNPDGSGAQYGATDGSGNEVSPDYPSTFPKNGQRTPQFKEVYALSKAGVQPSGSLTWFQAMEACASSGKRLPTDHEWLRAASGTNDPGASNGQGGACVTKASGARATGQGSVGCVSAWGAQDMIGNVWEWTANWYGGMSNLQSSAWPEPAYNGDYNWNIGGEVSAGSAGNVSGLPAAAFRGGDWGSGVGAAVFTLNLTQAPSGSSNSFGFRCVAR